MEPSLLCAVVFGPRGTALTTERAAARSRVGCARPQAGFCVRPLSKKLRVGATDEMPLTSTGARAHPTFPARVSAGRAHSDDDRHPNFGAMKATANSVDMPPTVDPLARLVFIVNTAAGSVAPENKRAAIEGALAEAGRKGELRFVCPTDLAQAAEEAAFTALHRRSAVVAVGGDGTLNAVARAAHAHGCAMGLVPQGTFNYFARTHGLPEDAAEATRVLLHGAPMPVQVGVVNEQLFLVNAGLGLFPEMLKDREAYTARFGRHRLVVLFASATTLLRTHRPLRLRIRCEGSVREITTPTLFVDNNQLQLERLGLPEAEAPADGRLAAMMLRPLGTLAMLGLMLRGAMGTLGEVETIERFEFTQMQVRPRLLPGQRLIRVAMDGEISRLRVPLDIGRSPRPLFLIKPLP